MAGKVTYRPHCLAKNERNRALIADYLGGLSRAQTAKKYGLHLGRFNIILRAHNVLLPPEERERRIAAVRPPKSPGRPAIWPDCPPELAGDYALLRRKRFRAAEARRMLDPSFRP